MTMLEECLEALGQNKIVLSDDETIKIFKSFSSTFPITKWGVIDWTKISNKYIVNTVDDILHAIETKKTNANRKVYILWDEGSLPSVKVDLEKVLNVIDDVTAVSFDTWLYNLEGMYVIEFNHEGTVTIGFL